MPKIDTIRLETKYQTENFVATLIFYPTHSKTKGKFVFPTMSLPSRMIVVEPIEAGSELTEKIWQWHEKFVLDYPEFNEPQDKQFYRCFNPLSASLPNDFKELNVLMTKKQLLFNYLFSFCEKIDETFISRVSTTDKTNEFITFRSGLRTLKNKIEALETYKVKQYSG